MAHVHSLQNGPNTQSVAKRFALIVDDKREGQKKKATRTEGDKNKQNL